MPDIMVEIQARRAYRSLVPEAVPVCDVELMVQAAQLAPSCFNNQPWRFIAVNDREVLSRMHTMLGKTNGWMTRSPVILAVCSHRDLDCKQSDGRDYYMFDCGMAVALLMMQATRMGYVAHPVSGFSPLKIKPLLGIPDSYTLIALVNVGRHGHDLSLLDDEQKQSETGPRIRKPLAGALNWNRYEFGDKCGET